MNIYLASDHGGFEYKQALVRFLADKGFSVMDCGNTRLDQADDYPDFVATLASRMLADPEGLGIVLCRNGVGVSIAANRYPHLRAGLGINEGHVQKARMDDNINVLSVASDYLDLERVKKMVDVFVDTPFSNADRHVRRLAKVSKLTTRS